MNLSNKFFSLIKEYVFNHGSRTPEMIHIKPAPVILVEGLFILSYEPVNNILDLRIFIEADEEIKLNRRLKRDLQERGMSPEEIHYQWKNQVMPSFQKYLIPYKDKSDILIENNHDFEHGLELVIERLNEIINP